MTGSDSATTTGTDPVRVMLVDDHPVVRAGLRAILDSFGDITVVAEGSDGADAQDATVENVDVVVMDIQMAGTDGITATRNLVTAGGPPVLILTTYDTEADIVEALAAGARGYLLKDAPEDELHRAVLATAGGDATSVPRWHAGSDGPTWRCRAGRPRSSGHWRPGRPTRTWLPSCSSRRRR